MDLNGHGVEFVGGRCNCSEMNNWKPLNSRNNPNYSREIFEGVPSHLESHLISWLGSFLSEFDARAVCLTMYIEQNKRTYLETLIDFALQDEDNFLNVLDCALYISQEARARGGNSLKYILAQGGSVWGVQPGYLGLTRRISEELSSAIDEISRSALSERQHVLAAWQALHNRQPNYSLAYSESIKALETIFIPLTIPKDKLATLGKVIIYLDSEKTILKNIFAEDFKSESKSSVLSLLKLIWRNQDDRHGAEGGAQPIDENLATFAVYTTLMISIWVQNGVYF